jgi:hypothetical protein
MRIRKANGASIMCDNVRSTLRPDRLLHDLAQLELALLLGDSMSRVTAFDVVELKTTTLRNYVNSFNTIKGTIRNVSSVLSIRMTSKTM